MAAEGDDELEQAKARLRRHGYKVERLRNERRAARAKPSDILLEPQKLEAELRQAGYGTGEYEHDKAIVKAAYLAAAGTIGASIIERMETIILEMREHYLGAGAPEEDRLNELVTAVRDWLPFVSVSGYIALYDQGGVLPPLVREAGLPPVARLGHLAAMPQASAMPSLEEAPRPDNSKFLPWRAFDDTYEEAPRRTVLAKSDAVSERALRNALYTDHPVLLLLPKVSTPEEIETLLARSSEERAYLLQQLVTEIVAYLEQTVVALRDGLRPDDALDWNRLDPLLIWAGGMLTEDEAKTSYLHVLMEDLREEVKPWTITDTLTLASVVIAIAITVASWGAAGPMAAVIAAIDVSVAVTDLTVSLYVASNENQLREKLNRFAHVDAALGVAISPESPGLTLLLGLLGLTASGAGFVSAARRAALQRTMAKAAEREAARFGGITRFRVEDSPPLPSTRPDAPSPQAAPPSPSPSSAKPGPSTAKTGGMADEAVERVDLPSTSAAKPEPPSVKGEALQPEPEPAPAQAKRPSATSPRFVDEVGEQQDSLLKRLTDDGGDVASPEAMADFIAALQRSRQMGVAGAADEGLAELQAALERGLARLAARNPVAWERLLDDAWRAGGTKAVEDVFNNTRRGTARLAGADPDGAAAREASRLNMQKRLEQRSREASIASARDTASRIDPLERATSNPADLR